MFAVYMFFHLKLVTLEGKVYKIKSRNSYFGLSVTSEKLQSNKSYILMPRKKCVWQEHFIYLVNVSDLLFYIKERKGEKQEPNYSSETTYSPNYMAEIARRKTHTERERKTRPKEVAKVD